jgi:hypothetical protein
MGNGKLQSPEQTLEIRPTKESNLSKGILQPP